MAQRVIDLLGKESSTTEITYTENQVELLKWVVNNPNATPEEAAEATGYAPGSVETILRRSDKEVVMGVEPVRTQLEKLDDVDVIDTTEEAVFIDKPDTISSELMKVLGNADYNLSPASADTYVAHPKEVNKKWIAISCTEEQVEKIREFAEKMENATFEEVGEMADALVENDGEFDYIEDRTEALKTIDMLTDITKKVA